MRVRVPPVIGAAVSLAVLATGCSTDAQPPVAPSGRAAAPSGSAAAPTLAPCVSPGPEVPLAADFPSEFPFPPGTVITTSDSTAAGGSYADGYAPVDLEGGIQFFREHLAPAGFTLVLWENDQIEADGAFRGHGLTGTWIIVPAPDCPGVVYVSVGTYAESSP